MLRFLFVRVGPEFVRLGSFFCGSYQKKLPVVNPEFQVPQCLSFLVLYEPYEAKRNNSSYQDAVVSCPSLKHASEGGRWLCIVGGWDGSRRLASVAALDTERGVWEEWKAAPGNCPPAGLSSHTCTRLSDRELRVAGREGGVRTQRRYGSIYALKLDPGARTYCYKEEGCRTVSRSGHCAALLQTPGPHPGHQLLLFGGCSSAEPEVAGQWSHGKIQEQPPVAPHLTEQLARIVSSGKGTQRGPRGLRHHSCSVVGPFAVLFGGESLTRARDTICNDLYIYDTRKPPSLWFHFPSADRGLKRVGHRTCLWNDQLYLLGGFGEDGRTASPQVCSLDLLI
ncbi:Kelch domain-containing protein 9 [Fukomys damarensis]|uniref:Kelch domain-containing protein 9 n=1 Tax=Fukomys damarensis TaxID=885580 RepID=A0A091CI93_FUKDA|nr:Kelch domain-containing protein 9 [Fukomys damarensis]